MSIDRAPITTFKGNNGMATATYDPKKHSYTLTTTVPSSRDRPHYLSQFLIHLVILWTRDTSYSVDLALAALKPQASMNSLLFKVSGLKKEYSRGEGDRQIVQDTGTGSSYPISSDRVVWALAARTLLDHLDGDKRTQFRDIAFEVIKNTIDHERHVIFDANIGLYSGIQTHSVHTNVFCGGASHPHKIHCD